MELDEITEMENYVKGENVEEQLDRNKVPFNDISQSYLWMQVKGGSRMPNLLSHVSGLLEDEVVKAVVWTGAGVAIPKAITCAEIVKRQFRVPYQLTKLTYKTDEEYWDPKLEGLERIVIKRQIPVIHIMLSFDEIEDKTQLGYQPLEGKKFWQDENVTINPKPSQGHKSKKHNKNKKDHKQ